MSKPALLSVADALARVLAGAEPLPIERVAVGAALGRTLAHDLIARRTQPPFANSAMDGYALRSLDALAPGRLRLIGESAAGRPFAGALAPGQAVRIFTGAPIPAGADAVLVQEDAERQGDDLIFEKPQPPGHNIRAIGIDFASGETLLRAGRCLSARDIGLAAAANHAEIEVRRRPRVGVLATGDELVQPGQAIGEAQIVASNNFAVAGLVHACGGEAIDLGIAPDEMSALGQKFAQAAGANADILVTLGGASVGDYDLVQKALTGAGLELGFWRIAMRPGKPLMHGRLGAMHVLGLPGNPVSSAVCAVLFLRPLLRALQGDPQAGADMSEPARLGADVAANDQRQDYLRAVLAQNGDGPPLATPFAPQDSSLVKVLAQADALLLRPPFAPPGKRGDACRILRLGALGL